MSNSITIIGSLNYDMVTYTYVLPEAGQTVLSNHFECHYGGKGLNQAISAGKLAFGARFSDNCENGRQNWQ